MILSFINIETNLILYLYPKKWIKFNQSESCKEADKFEILRAHLSLIYRNGRNSLILKTGFWFFSPKSKNGFRRLSNRDYGYLIQIFSIQSHSKVFSSELKKTLECDILNPDRIINLEIKNEMENKQYLISRLRKRVD